jgi:protein-disulfide isomerase
MLTNYSQVFLLLVTFSFSSFAQSPTPNEEFDNRVKEFILKNPEIIIQSLEQYKKNYQNSMKQVVNNYIKANLKLIENTDSSPYYGDIRSDVIIVMFFDYNCGYCKKSNLIINQLLERDKKIKIIYKPYPILGPRSDYINRIALAVYLQYPQKFKSFHDLAMITADLSEASVKMICQKTQIDFNKVNNFIKNNKLQDMQSNTLSTIQSLNISGVPSFIINGQLYPGMININEFSNIIKQIREGHNS